MLPIPRFSHLRHIHIPDAPPHYPPFNVASQIQNFLRTSIKKQRKVAEGQSDSSTQAPESDENSAREQLRRALPPPAVISFTPHPTFFHAPGHDKSELDELRKPIRLVFPRLPDIPDMKLRSNFGSHRMEHVNFTVEGDPFDHVYTPDVKKGSHLAMPPYLGPGQVVLWPVMDLLDMARQLPMFPKNLFEYQTLLAQTTMTLLRNEFNIEAYPDPKGTGLWVRYGPSSRKIASIWPKVDENGIAGCGVAINVGNPVKVPHGANPLSYIKQASEDTNSNTTSILLELRRDEKKAIERPKSSIKLHRLAGTMGVFKRTIWYTRAFNGKYSSAPLGMDNYPLAAAFAHEFACQMKIRKVDHRGNGTWDVRTARDKMGTRNLMPERPRVLTQTPEEHTKTLARMAGEKVKEEFYDQDRQTRVAEASDLRAAKGDIRVPSWELTCWRMLRVLGKSTEGGPFDTRLRDDGSTPEPEPEMFQDDQPLIRRTNSRQRLVRKPVSIGSHPRPYIWNNIDTKEDAKGQEMTS